jgi:hypothetical protein
VLIVDTKSVLELLHYEIVGYVTDVSDVHSASIFIIEV